MDLAKAVGTILDAWRNGEAGTQEEQRFADEIYWFNEYADGGDAPKGIAAANWNGPIGERVSRLLEKAGVQIEWSDMVTGCNGCDKCIQTEPDCHWWRPQFVVTDGAVYCAECAQDDAETYIEECEGKLCPDFLDPAEHGYTLWSEGHRFVYAKDLAAEMKAKGVKRWTFKQDRSYECDVYVHNSEPILNPEPYKHTGLAPVVSRDDYRDAVSDYMGWCPHCLEFTTSECEPDAVHRECDECGKRDVVGAEEATILGWIEVDDT